MLWSNMEGTKIVTPLGDKIGTLDDLEFNGETWKVSYVIIKEGALKRKYFAVEPAKIEIKEDEDIELSPEVERKDYEFMDPPSIHHMYITDLIGKKVESSDGEIIGKVYDVDVATELEQWEIWKILIKVGIKERRLRIGPDEIKDLGETLVLKKRAEEIKEE